MDRAIRTLLVIAGCWALAGPVTPARAAWTIADIGTLGGSRSEAKAVDGNIVVGKSKVTGDTAEHAFAYDLGASTPTIIDLGVLTGGTNSEAVAVDGHIVVGTSDTATGKHAFAYDLTTSTMKDLGTLGGTTSEARGVSGNIVVGKSFTSNDEKRAFAYDLSTSTMKDLGTLGSESDLTSEGVGVSGNIVAVQADVPAPDGFGGTLDRASVYDLGAASPSLVDLGTLSTEGGESFARAISGTIIVGNAATKDSGTHPFAYDFGAPSPTMLDLGSIDSCDTSDPSANAVDGNLVAGQASTDDCSAAIIFAVDLGASPLSTINLGNLGGGFIDAFGVSGNLIVGTGTLAGDTDLRGYYVDMSDASPSMAELPLLSAGKSTFAAAVSGITIVGLAVTADDKVHAVVWQFTSTTPTTTGLTSSANPSVIGQQVTYTATVSPAPDGGTVEFKDGTSTISGCASRSVNTSTGVATCQVTYTSPGTHSITAVYSGNGAFETSTSSDLTQKVGYGIKVLSKPPDGKTGWKSGITVPLKLQLVNNSGRNLSAGSIVLTVTGLSPSPAPGTPPTGTFTFKAPQYQLDVKTTKYPVGTYTLSFTVSGDPVVHTVTFKIL